MNVLYSEKLLEMCTCVENQVEEIYPACETTVYGHFGPKTLRTRDISALCVWCRSVSHFCVGAEVPLDTLAPVPKCLGQFGTKVHETLRSSDQ